MILALKFYDFKFFMIRSCGHIRYVCGKLDSKFMLKIQDKAFS